MTVNRFHGEMEKRLYFTPAIEVLSTKPQFTHTHTPHNMCLTDGHTHSEPICHCDFRHPHIHCDLDTHTCSLSLSVT